MYGTDFLPDHSIWNLKDEKEIQDLRTYYATLVDSTEEIVIDTKQDWSDIQIQFLESQFQNVMHSVQEKRYTLEELSSLHCFIKALISMSLQLDVAFTIEQLMTMYNYMTLVTIGPRASTDMILYLLDKLFIAIFSNTSIEIMSILDNSKLNVGRYSLLDQAIMRLLMPN
jgi:hypothetical protein